MSYYRSTNERYARLCAEADSTRPQSGPPARTAPLPDHHRATLATIAAALDATVPQLTVHVRGKAVDERRQIAMWLLRRRGLSLPQIGRLLERDHSSVSNGLDRVEARRCADPAFARRLQELHRRAG